MFFCFFFIYFCLALFSAFVCTVYHTKRLSDLVSAVPIFVQTQSILFSSFSVSFVLNGNCLTSCRLLNYYFLLLLISPLFLANYHSLHIFTMVSKEFKLYSVHLVNNNNTNDVFLKLYKCFVIVFALLISCC